MAVTLSILLWNARSLFSNLGEFQKLVQDTQPSVICVTETWFVPGKPFHLKGYDVFRADRDAVGGGVAIMSRLDLGARPLSIPAFANGDFEFLGISFSCRNTSYQVLNFYSPHGNFTQTELDHYLSRVHGNFVVCGDFNARHGSWDSSGTNPAGRVLDDFLSSSPTVCLYTPCDLGTRYNPISGTFSTLDLFLGCGTLFPRSLVTRGAETGTSDHLPTFLHLEGCSRWDPLTTRGRWKLDDALWPRWVREMKELNLLCSGDLDTDVQSFVAQTLSVSEAVFRRTSGRYSFKYSAPWWNADCSLAIACRRRAKRILRRHYSAANFIAYRRAVASSKRTIRQTKRSFWRNFCSLLSSTTPLARVWRIYRSISGRTPPQRFPLVTQFVLTSLSDKANALADYFSQIVGTPKPIANEDAICREIELALLTPHESLDRPFSPYELSAMLVSLPRDKACGVDNIPYEFLVRLPGTAHQFLLGLCNTSLREGAFPSSQKHGLVVSFLKPGKDPSQVSSYRPISLLPVLGKAIEKLLNARLYWYLEANGKLPSFQAGFRKQRSTIDQLVRLEHHVRCSLKSRKVLIVVFLDMSKAFDRVPHRAVLVKLARMGVTGTFLKSLQDFLSDRTFQVFVNGEFSTIRPLLCGLPQGAHLSPLLYNVFLSDVPLVDGVHYSAYADDFCFYAVADDATTAKNFMQMALDEFHGWCQDWNVEVSSEKSCMQVYTRQRLSEVPDLLYGQRRIPYRGSHKFLGLIFDCPTLTWRPHILGLVEDCRKRLNLMRCCAGSSWGGDRKTLLLLYKSLIRSKIDYGSQAYGSACKSLLSKLEVVQNTALRIALGALRSSPIISLRGESLCSPVLDRLHFNIRSYFNKASFFPSSHPVKSEILLKSDSVLQLNWASSANGRPAFVIAEQLRLKWNLPFISLANVSTVFLHPLPPWDRFLPEVRSQLALVTKTSFPDVMLRSIFLLSISRHFSGFTRVFTDGSRFSSDGTVFVGASFCIPSLDVQLCCRLHSLHSVLAAELIALLKALQWVGSHVPAGKVVFCSDSRAALESLRSPVPAYKPLVYDCLLAIKALQDAGFTVAFHWVPAHCGIKGNELADRLAKEGATNAVVARYSLHFLEYNTVLKERFATFLAERWQRDKDEVFLGRHKLSWQDWPWSFVKDRGLEVAMARLRIGHSRLGAHMFRIGLATSPNCVFCGVPETVEHFLMRCYRFHSLRCGMLAAISRLGVQPITLSVLLGGGVHTLDMKGRIAYLVMGFLRKSGRLGSL